MFFCCDFIGQTNNNTNQQLNAFFLSKQLKTTIFFVDIENQQEYSLFYPFVIKNVEIDSVMFYEYLDFRLKLGIIEENTFKFFFNVYKEIDITTLNSLIDKINKYIVLKCGDIKNVKILIQFVFSSKDNKWLEMEVPSPPIYQLIE